MYQSRRKTYKNVTSKMRSHQLKGGQKRRSLNTAQKMKFFIKGFLQ